jgi:seryl-tRNA synthetase
MTWTKTTTRQRTKSNSTKENEMLPASALKKIKNRAKEVSLLKRKINVLSDKLKPLQTELKELQERESEIRVELPPLLQTAGKRRVITNNAVVELTTPLPSVKVVDEDSVPDGYYELVKKIDKKLILKTYREEGDTIEGTQIVLGDPSVKISLQQ